MKFLLHFLSLFFTVHGLLLEEEFQNFKKSFGKVYKTQSEEERRFAIFADNLKDITTHNAGSSTYKRGVNEWTDLTQKEWEDLYLGGYKHIAVHHRAGDSNKVSVEDLPSKVDWREKGVITPVKNQGHCGSCWAFGTTEQVESYTALATNETVELSAQQVTSCTPNPLTCGGTGGCMGSTPPLGYNYVQLFGQVKEEDYPYMSGTTAETEECGYDLSTKKPVASITGYDNLPANDQAAIMNHIANVGPLAISVAANGFKDYSSGVFDGCDYDENIQLNHSVQLVGYGSDFSPAGVVDYWLVRNSWGTNFGEDGYIRMLRETEPRCGTDTTTSGHVCEGGPGNDILHVCGMCGMLFETSFPLGAHLL